MRRLLVLVSAAMLVDTMFYAALTPLLPHYVDRLGLTKTGAGVLTASFGAGTLLGAVPAGLAAARFGPKRTVLGGLLLLAATSVGFAFGDRIWLLDGARFLQGAAGACTWTGALAWLVSRAPRERRGELIGTALAAGIAGALIGPVLGAVARSVGTRPVFGGVAVAALGIAAAVALGPAGGPGAAQPLRGLASHVRDRRFLSGMWLVALPAMLFGALTVLAPLRLHALGFGAAGIGAAFLLSAGLEAAASPVLGRLSDRRGPFLLIRVGLVAGAAVSLVVPWLGNAWALAAAVALAGVAYGTFWVPALALLSQGADDAGLDQSFAFALMNLAWAAGQGIGSLGGGALGQAAGDAVPYSAGAGLCLLTLAFVGGTRLTALRRNAYAETR